MRTPYGFESRSEHQFSCQTNDTYFLIMFIPNNWYQNPDGSYDVHGNITLSKCYVSGGKLCIKFRKVTGDFSCDKLNLRVLLGCPKEVGGTFSCCENKLITLDGGPTTVGKDYICSESQLGSLAGAPKVIHGDFICKYNFLRLLTGAPTRITGTFNYFCNDLLSLEGGPTTVGKHYICSNNNLRDLCGAPKTVYGDFNCNWNKLSSLTGSPTKVYGEFNCSHNRLRYFAGITGIKKLQISYNPMKEFNAKYFPLLLGYEEMCDGNDDSLEEIKRLFTGIQKINWKDFRGSIQKYINWLPENIHIEHINLNSKQQKELHAIQISRI